MFKSFKIIFIGLIFFIFPFIVQAAEIEFNVDPSYDYSGRAKINAFLHQIGENAYFYVEDPYYQNLDIEKKKELSQALQNLSQEFDQIIYPKLRETFGLEWNPGIDNDSKITVLITRIKGDAGGYFNSGDEYSVLQSPNSNQKEMVYLNADYITSPLAKGFLAHEFTHLITFNQKDRVKGVQEEIWLNEMRSEAAPRILGYDDNFDSSNLQRRLRSFLQKPQDPLTEWKNEAPDYGVLNIFMQYLIDYYGVRIFSDSLASNKIGIPSLNEALQKRGYPEDFSQIFTNWTTAVLINDCNFGPKLCYANPNLRNLRVLPQINFLPSIGESSLAVVNYVKNWAGNWYKFIGGQGTLKLEFVGDEKANFKIPYLLEDNSGKLTLDFLKLDNTQRANQIFPEFGKKYRSLTIIPSLQAKLSGFDGLENYSKFIFTASISSENPAPNPEQELIAQLLAQIAVLQGKIAQLLAQSGGGPASSGCLKLENNLYFGLKDNQEVRCLQNFLKNQGASIYPEGLVTGNFFFATQAAVIRFQEKYASEILTPIGLQKGTGYVGVLTLNKINQLIK